MRQPSQAARRFYHAFYRWNLFLSSSTTTLSSHVQTTHRPLSTSTIRLHEGRPTKHVNRRLPLHQNHRIKRIPIPDSSRNDDSSKINSNIETKSQTLPPDAWLTVPPATSTEIPFDTLRVWEDIVRYRSGAGIMVQTSVPAKRIAELEEIYGRNLSGMSEKVLGKGGARVEVGSSFVEKEVKDGGGGGGGEGERVKVLSVLYSGTFDEVGRLWGELRGTKAGRGMDESKSVSVPGNVKHEGMAKLLQRKGESESVVRGYLTLSNRNSQSPHSPPSRTWHEKSPRSHESLPTSSVRLFALILRNRATSADDVTVETVIPAYCWSTDLWREYVVKPLLLQQRPGGGGAAKVQVGDLLSQSNPVIGQKYKMSVRSVDISGSVAQVQVVIDGIMGLQKRLIENRAKLTAAKGREEVVAVEKKERKEEKTEEAQDQPDHSTSTSYARLAIPASLAGYVICRTKKIVGNTGRRTMHQEQQPSKEEESSDQEGKNNDGEKIIVLRCPTQEAVERAKNVMKKVVDAAWRKSGWEGSAEGAVRVIEEGEEESSTTAAAATATQIDSQEEKKDESSQHQQQESPERQDDKTDFKAYCTFTIPHEVRTYISSRPATFRRKSGCLLKFTRQWNGVDENGQRRSGVTIWGRTEKDVRKGMDLASEFVRKWSKERGVQDWRLHVVESGLKNDAGVGGVEEETPEVEMAPDNGRAAEVQASLTTPQGNQNDPVDLLGPTGFWNDVEGGEDSAESRDDFLFPEFNPVFASDLPASTNNERASVTTYLPAVTVNIGNPKTVIQQRSYSTFRASGRSKSTATFTPRNAEETANLDEADEDVISTPTTEQVAENLKRALRTLTHPVVLVTSRLPQYSETYDSRLDICRGVTISSFTTVTLSPKPIISFNLRVPSRSWDAMISSKRLMVHILSATPRGAALAHPFTQPYEQPGEPFRRLERLGVQVQVNSGGKSNPSKIRPPRLSWDGAILARVTARLQTSKCVHVGDHVIAVAEVSSVNFPADTVLEAEGGGAVTGLAYAMRGYRGVGEGIEPVEVPSAFEDGEASSSDATRVVRVEEPSSAHDARNQLSTTDRDDGDAVDGMQAKALNEESISVDREQEDHVKLDDLIAREGGENESGRPGEHSKPSTLVEDYFEQSEQPLSEENRAQDTFETRRNGPKRGDQYPWGISPSSRSQFSTLATLGYQKATIRYYTTSSTTTSTEGDKQNNSISIYSQVSDPEILSSTVADFLDLPDDDSTPPPRIRGLMRAQKEIHKASHRLQRALADGSLTAEESSRLENVILRNERRIAKTLALRSAKDLRRMLDKGRVDVRRAQWLESSIEKGQAVLLEEARQLRVMFDEKTINADQFRKVKGMLEQQNQVLTAEATRLRQMVDEDLGEGGEEPAEERKFDGFRGNI